MRAAARAGGRARRRFLRDSEGLTALLFLLPVLVLWCWWFLIPLFKSFSYCLYEFNYAIPERTHFVGLQNFRELFADTYFLQAMVHSVQLVAVTVPAMVACGLLLSVLLNQKLPGRGVIRTVCYMPYVLSPIAVATVFMYLLVGGKLVPTLCAALLGMDNVTWFSDTRYALLGVMAMVVWQQVGFYMVMFLAGLQGIPGELREAARIDGASALQEFTRITLPLLRPIIALSVAFGIISSFKIFDQISAISRNTVLGAPAGSTSTIVTYFYVHAFRYGDVGYASAAVVVLFLIIFALTLVQRVLTSRYEKQ